MNEENLWKGIAHAESLSGCTAEEARAKMIALVDSYAFGEGWRMRRSRHDSMKEVEAIRWEAMQRIAAHKKAVYEPWRLEALPYPKFWGYDLEAEHRRNAKSYWCGELDVRPRHVFEQVPDDGDGEVSSHSCKRVSQFLCHDFRISTSEPPHDKTDIQVQQPSRLPLFLTQPDLPKVYKETIEKVMAGQLEMIPHRQELVDRFARYSRRHNKLLRIVMICNAVMQKHVGARLGYQRAEKYAWVIVNDRQYLYEDPASGSYGNGGWKIICGPEREFPTTTF